MAIAEEQLKTWSKLGTQARSQGTYESIRKALANHRWLAVMGPPRVYVQGSYRNHTNVAGDSDVDVVAETPGVFYSDLTDGEKLARGMGPGADRPGRDGTAAAAVEEPGAGTVGQRDLRRAEVRRVRRDRGPHLEYNRPMVFKNHAGRAHAGRASFEPGFGCSIAEAVVASCAAFPVFGSRRWRLRAAAAGRWWTAALCANNPAHFALTDATEALGVERDRVRLLSAGRARTRRAGASAGRS